MVNNNDDNDNENIVEQQLEKRRLSNKLNADVEPKEQNFDGQLTPITEIAELCQLRDLYGRDWPRHCVGYYCLDNFIRWLRHAPDMPNLKILTLNGDWHSEGLCLIVDRYQLFVNSLHTGEDNTQLSKAISLLDWSVGYKVSAVRHCHHPAVLSVIEAKHLKLDYNNETLMYYMANEQARKLQVNCLEGFILKSIKLSDARIIDDLWLNKHPGSLFLIKRLIEWNVNAGVYKEDTDELVAWCLRLQGGFLGALQVKAEYKRLKLGTIVAAATSKKIAEIGHDVMALVYETNKGARGLFEKLGFKIVDKCYWLKPFPTIDGFQWPDDM